MRKPHPQSPWLRLDLTDRQREILDLFNAGLTLRAISTQLHLSPNTVRQHLDYALAKGVKLEQERAWQERIARERAEAAM